MSCGMCSDCACQTPSKEELYQIHITVKMGPGDYFRFDRICKELGIKALFIENVAYSGKSYLDTFTSSVFKGTREAALQEMFRLAEKLETTWNFEVVRRKLETPPWNASQNKENVLYGQYWECHFEIPIKDISMQKEHELKKLAEKLGLHVSYNVERNDVIMLTNRKKETFQDAFFKENMDLLVKLGEHGYVTNKHITEYAEYDDNEAHDNLWLEIQTS